MLSTKGKHFTILFALLLLGELVCSSIPSLLDGHYLTKPSLLVALIFYFYRQSTGLSKEFRWLTLLGLIFSLGGDVFLMFVAKSSHYFIAGLLSFLIAHIFYCILFLKHRNPKVNFTGLFIGILVYAVTIFYLLKDGLGSLLIPVILYVLVILTMLITAYLRRGKVAPQSFIFVFIGAILFVISDSILALNKFYRPLEFTNIRIMLSYALAQYFIVMGLLKLR